MKISKLIFFDASIENRLEIRVFSKSTFDFLSISIFLSQSDNIEFVNRNKEKYKKIENHILYCKMWAGACPATVSRFDDSIYSNSHVHSTIHAKKVIFLYSFKKVLYLIQCN